MSLSLSLWVNAIIKQQLPPFYALPRNWGRTIDISQLFVQISNFSLDLFFCFFKKENHFIIYWLELNLEIMELNLPETLCFTTAASSILAPALSKHPIKKVRRSCSQLGSSKKWRSSGGSDGRTASHHQAQEYF